MSNLKNYLLKITYNNYDKLCEEHMCACLVCCNMFFINDLSYMEDNSNNTAICPHCNNLSIVPWTSISKYINGSATSEQIIKKLSKLFLKEC